MILAQHYILPDENGFRGLLLDDLLALGYYRMQHMIFTTHNTGMDAESESIPVFWLRTPVRQVQENKAAIAIRKKCSAFKVIYKKAAITAELEELYALYRNHVDFVVSATCREYLHQNDLDNPYDSWMIEVREDTRLVAAGFFDKGRNAISGILNFYHPEYNKYSLGKFLILKKIDYANANGITYYYTGYISTAISKFDYKLFPDKAAIEVYLPIDKTWVPYSLLGKEKLRQYNKIHLNFK